MQFWRVKKLKKSFLGGEIRTGDLQDKILNALSNTPPWFFFTNAHFLLGRKFILCDIDIALINEIAQSALGIKVCRISKESSSSTYLTRPRCDLMHLLHYG